MTVCIPLALARRALSKSPASTSTSTSRLSLLRLSRPSSQGIHPRGNFLVLNRPLSTTTPNRQTSPMAAQTDTAAAETAASSGVTADSLTEKLKATIGATHVSIEDMSGGCGQAFNAIIVSPEFEKKTLLARHRLVNNALKAEIAAIHAWTPKCLTPEQWEKEKEKMGM
ncbi:uncharacterized protein PV06_04294 [Exophiala oligosperma]|uniref:BolA protein n=2 Tax=Chaetothyriales TaxID=34395 RepID=A0A0D2E5S3_9EURO|nr:uncharacterized protein PV06_04294 [Exophiala oligosperma]KIW43159.1 hypothetical protein PV06_04294 [Exophiala oligosperma]